MFAWRKTPTATEEMSIIGHLTELRQRIVRSMLAVALGASFILIFYDQFLSLLTRPYVNLCARRPDFNCAGELYALGPIEGLSQRMRISGYGGLIIALPVVMWQIWRFVVPALSSREKKYSIPFILSSVILFLFGGALAYWTLDKALEFLISWSGEGVEQTYQISRYISLVALMVLAFGVGFLLPVMIVPTARQRHHASGTDQAVACVLHGHLRPCSSHHSERRSDQHACARHSDVVPLLGRRSHWIRRPTEAPKSRCDRR